MAHRYLQGVGTCSYAAHTGASQVYCHDVWRITVVVVDVVHRGRYPLPVRPQYAAAARNRRPVAEVPDEGEIIDALRCCEGCSEPRYLPHPERHVVSGINLYDPGGELQTDLDQGVGCGLLQEVQPALDLLDPQLQVDCDVRQASRQGLISAPLTFTTANKYMSNPDLTPLITDLNERSAAPLSVVESDFAADGTGFSTCRFDRWYDAKWGKEKSQRHWLKAHIVCGTQTNIVTSVEITPSNVHDSPVLPGLLDTTAKRFTMAEVSADKAYLSDANLRHIEGHGAYPYIPFKSNTTGQGSPMWKRLYAYFTLHEEAWKPTTTSGQTSRQCSAWSRGSLGIPCGRSRRQGRSTRSYSSSCAIISAV